MRGAKQNDSFISYLPLATNYTLIQKNGIEEFARQEIAKMELLSYLLKNYNEGRSKKFYCTSCQLLPLDSLKVTVAEAEKKINEIANIKEKSRLIKAAITRLAETLGIDFMLRT